MAITFDMTVSMVIYAHARFDDLDLDARSQWVSRGKMYELIIISTTRQVISIKLATTLGHVWPDLDIENLYMAWPACLFLPPGGDRSSGGVQEQVSLSWISLHTHALQLRAEQENCRGRCDFDEMVLGTYIYIYAVLRSWCLLWHWPCTSWWTTVTRGVHADISCWWTNAELRLSYVDFRDCSSGSGITRLTPGLASLFFFFFFFFLRLLRCISRPPLAVVWRRLQPLVCVACCTLELPRTGVLWIRLLTMWCSYNVTSDVLHSSAMLHLFTEQEKIKFQQNLAI